MKNDRILGLLLLAGAAGVMVPYTWLTLHFDYPQVLRLPAGQILERFAQGGRPLIWAWLAFAWAGLPLLAAYVRLGQLYEAKAGSLRVLTTLGLISGLAQILGLLRWSFLVPVLAQRYMAAPTQDEKQMLQLFFAVLHQGGGVLLGEHVGQLLTVAWTLGVSLCLWRIGRIHAGLAWAGIASALVYALAQTELLATVMPGLPQVAWAGFVGSTLWLLWLVGLGIAFLFPPKAKGLLP